MIRVESFGATFDCIHPQSAFSQLLKTDYFDIDTVDEVECDFSEISTKQIQVTQLLLNCHKKLALRWGSYTDGKNLTYDPDGIVVFNIRPHGFIENNVLDQIKKINWEVAVFSSLHYEWEELNYDAPGFGGGLGVLGWGCAFKGEGHNRVVSRRFLEFNPWRVIRDEEHDITLIQFHDLEASPELALEQARVGHDIMAKPLEGGFYQRNLRLSNVDFSGVYEPEDQTLRVMIPVGEIVTRAQMMDACKIRHFQLGGEDQPLKNVGLVAKNTLNPSYMNCGLEN
jgi:hypothetical protein